MLVLRRRPPAFGVSLSSLFVLAAVGLYAADWDRFRGPNGTGVAADKNVPVKWTESDVRFRVDLPGVGHSSPIVVGSRVVLLSATRSERLVLCYDADTGKELWTKKVKGGVGKTHAKSSLASATPCSDGKRVFCVFWDGARVDLFAYDLDGGKELWHQPLGAFVSQHGPGFSPMLAAGKVIVNVDQDGAAKLMAFDAETGKEAWKVDRKAFRACYSTPILVQGSKGGGQDLLVTTTAGITAYDPTDGKEKWKHVWAFPVKPLRTVGSSIVVGDLVFACSGDGDGSRAMIAVKLGSDGKAGPVWALENNTPYVPTLLAKDKHLYTVNDDGTVYCRVAATGEEVWKARLGGGVSASPVMIDGKVYAFGEKGDATVFPASPDGFKMLARNSLGEKVMASPAVAKDRLYVRTEKQLVCIGKNKGSKE